MDKFQIANKCDNCLCWLHVCEAQCCKEFKVHNSLLARKRDYYVANAIISPREYFYWHLRGCRIIAGKLWIPVKTNKIIDGEFTIFYRTCSALNDNNTCSLHDTPDKPFICQEFDETGSENQGLGYAPSNCLACYKKVK